MLEELQSVRVGFCGDGRYAWEVDVSVAVVTASVAEQIVQVIREAIRTGQLTPGQLYSVDQVIKDLGLTVSRTPVREALVRLAEAGMVQAKPNRGYEILKPELHDLEELFQLRLMLEVPATYRAARRASEDEKLLGQLVDGLQVELDAMTKIAQTRDEPTAAGSSGRTGNRRLEERDLEFVVHDTRFHELILKAGGNERLVALVRNLRAIITTRGAWRLSDSRQEGLPEVMAEHQPVLDYIKQRDAHGAAQAMYSHLKKTGDALMEHLEGLSNEGNFDRHWFEGVAIPRQRRR